MNALTVGGLFDGCGLLAYGLHLAGLEHEWLCEVDPWRRDLLAQRWPGVRCYDDVRAVGVDAVRVDVIAGGFPCKGASTAGKLNGFDHPETVLWREMFRAVRELRPRYVLVENVANLLAVRDGAVWGEVVGDLASLGMDVVWDCVPAAAFGAPHLRDRLIAVASFPAGADGERDGGQWGEQNGRADVAGGGHGITADAARERRLEAEPKVQQPRICDLSGAGSGRCGVRVKWGAYAPAIRRWESRSGAAPCPLIRRVDDRSAARVDRSRLSALGDGVQVQLGELAGRYILELERERLSA